MYNYPKPKIIFRDFFVICFFLFFGIDGSITLFQTYLFPTSVPLSLDYLLASIILIICVFASSDLIITQIIKGWTNNTFSEKVMPYQHLQMLFIFIFIGIIDFFFLEAIALKLSLFLIILGVVLFSFIPFAIILGLFSVTVFLSQRS